MFEKLLSRGGLSLDRLHSFCLVAEKGGIAKAFGNDLSKQALASRQIRELEGFFEIELTRRKGKGIEITEAGMALARMARTTFEGFADLQAKAAHVPINVRFAGGNSIFEWFLIPKLQKIQSALKVVRVELLDRRTHETIDGLIEHTVDIGMVRESAVAPPLKFHLAREIGYRLFVPKRDARNKVDLDSMPIAMALGGEFCEQVAALATRVGVDLNVRWRCASFTQAARLVEKGVCAALLPEIAADALGASAVAKEIPWLVGYRRRIGFAWHQRLLEARPAVGPVLDALFACRSEKNSDSAHG